MRMLTCKRLIAAAWISLGGIAFLVLIGQTVTERYGERVTDVWTWFSLYFLPAATIAFVAASTGESDSEANQVRVAPGVLLAALFSSVLYLVLMLVPILWQPFADAESPFQTLAQWGVVLAIFQSIVIGALASVYIRP